MSIQPKQGTTWTGHIAHQLLMRGQDVDPSRNLMMDLPYPEFAELLFGQRLHELDPPYWETGPWSQDKGLPLVIRSHVSHKDLISLNATEKEGYRLVTVLRDPVDMVISMWRFLSTVVGLHHS